MLNKYFLLSLILLSSHCHASMMQQIKDSSVRRTHQLGSIKLFHEQDKFIVEDEEGLHPLCAWQLDTATAKLAKNKSSIMPFQEVGFFEVKKDSEGYLLRSHVRAPGGGLVSGAFLFSALSIVLPASFAAINGVVAYKTGKDIGAAMAKGVKDGTEIAIIVGAATAIAPGV